MKFCTLGYKSGWTRKASNSISIVYQIALCSQLSFYHSVTSVHENDFELESCLTKSPFLTRKASNSISIVYQIALCSQLSFCHSVTSIHENDFELESCLTKSPFSLTGSF
jgi:hypothetical protein